MIRIEKNDINLYDTIFSGQCFRMTLEFDGSITIVIKDRVINIKEEKKYLIVDSNNKDNLEKVIIEYLDLNRDYNKINKELIKNDPYMKNIVELCKGYKILKQDPFEMIISYIISQNNRVPNISKSIEKICENYGQKVVFKGREYYLFPEFERLKNITSEELRSYKVGFRDKYILSAINFINENKNITNDIYEMDTKTALDNLLKVTGIGLKVASCILLFGYSKLDVFPIDTWVIHNIENNYKDVAPNIKSIEKFAKKQYKNLSGIAIQYMFHKERNK